LLKKKRQVQALKTRIGDLGKQFAKAQSDFQAREIELQTKANEIETLFDEVKQSGTRLRSENASLEERLKRLQSENVRLEAERQENEDAEQIPDQRGLVVQLRQDLGVSQQNVETLTSELRARESELQKVQRLLTAQKSQAAQQVAANEELQAQLIRVEKEAEAALDDERKRLSETFDATIAEFRDQAERQREDLARLSAELGESGRKVLGLQTTLRQVTREKGRLDRELTRLAEDSERERKLGQVTAKAKCLAAESDYRQRLEDARAAFEAETRAVLGVAFDAFKTLANPLDRMDLRSYKHLIQRARDELNRLAAAELEIRGLLAAGEPQPIPDAVAQFVINHEY
jgi:chromosome segregation ATPase